jgi:hypothetical protein
MTDVEVVKKNIEDIYKRKIVVTRLLCKTYAAEAEQLFRRFQTFDTFWTNRTEGAYDNVYGKSYRDGDSIGWFLAHAVKYGIYLELANDRKHEALRPTVMELLPKFMADLKERWE